MAGTVAVVTDSTAYLVPEFVAGHDIRVVPLQVSLAGRVYPEASGTDNDVAAALRRGAALTTSRPAPTRFAQVYAEAAAAGAPAIVSVHLSGRMSGTVDSARLAAAGAPVPVLVVDTRTVGAGLGFAVLAAARAAGSGCPLTDVAAEAARRSARLRSLFSVGSLDHLRHGGRIGGAAAVAGAALGAKPLMHIVDGQIAPFEKLRTRSRAVARLEQLAVEFAVAQAPVDVVVQHVANGERAAHLAQRLRARIPGVRSLHVSEAALVIAVHTGPDMLGVVVAPD